MGGKIARFEKISRFSISIYGGGAEGFKPVSRDLFLFQGGLEDAGNVADKDDIPDAFYDTEGDLQSCITLDLPDFGVQVAYGQRVDLFLVHIDHDVIDTPDIDGLVGVDIQSE
jgi:hypothetical protein